MPLATNPTTSTAQRADLTRLLTSKRLTSYVGAVATAHQALHHTNVFDHYVYNMSIASTLLGPLHILEVTCRNSMQAQLSSHFNRDDWWEVADLANLQVQVIADTWGPLDAAGKSVDDFVAGVSFGFWTGLLGTGTTKFVKGRATPPSKNYERQLWHPALSKAFPNSHRNRRQVAESFEWARMMRNRVGHHEPIFLRDPQGTYNEVIRLIRTISDPIADWVDDRSKMPRMIVHSPTHASPTVHF